MSLVPICILPSALLAWPLYYFCMRTVDSKPMAIEEAIEPLLALILTIASFIALHRIARRRQHHDVQPRSTIVKFLANRSTMERLWIVLQPIVLAFACWPGFTDQIAFVQYFLTGRILSFFLPSLLFFVCLHGVQAKLNWITFLPFLVLTTIAVACDGMKFTIAPNDWEADLWSLPSVTSVTMWSTVGIVLVSGLLTSLWLPAWIVWSSGAEPLCGNPNDNDANDDHVRSIRELWQRIHPTCPSILFWPTNCRISNAVIVSGLFQQRLLLTDRLLLRFTSTEIELIVLHELAHSIRRHAIVRLLPAVVSIPILACVMTSLSGMSLMIACTVLAVAFPFALVATCWWTEKDADKWAIRFAVQLKGFTIDEAKDRYGKVIRKLYHDNGIRRSSWSHPSCEQRLAAFQGN